MMRPGHVIQAAAIAAALYAITRERAPRADADRLTPAMPEAVSEAMDVAVAGMRPDGLPAEHPESMDLELAPADEVWLALVSDELWPCDEYEDIRADDGGQS
jgi:hypothetical protein